MFYFCKSIKKIMFKWVKLPSGCARILCLECNLWLLFCKLLRGLFRWTYSEYGPPEKGHHARLVQGLSEIDRSEQQVHLQHQLHLE